MAPHRSIRFEAPPTRGTLPLIAGALAALLPAAVPAAPPEDLPFDPRRGVREWLEFLNAESPPPRSACPETPRIAMPADSQREGVVPVPRGRRLSPEESAELVEEMAGRERIEQTRRIEATVSTWLDLARAASWSPDALEQLETRTLELLEPIDEIYYSDETDPDETPAPGAGPNDLGTCGREREALAGMAERSDLPGEARTALRRIVARSLYDSSLLIDRETTVLAALRHYERLFAGDEEPLRLLLPTWLELAALEPDARDEALFLAARLLGGPSDFEGDPAMALRYAAALREAGRPRDARVLLERTHARLQAGDWPAPLLPDETESGVRDLLIALASTSAEERDLEGAIRLSCQLQQSPFANPFDDASLTARFLEDAGRRHDAARVLLEAALSFRLGPPGRAAMLLVSASEPIGLRPELEEALAHLVRTTGVGARHPWAELHRAVVDFPPP